MNKSDDLLLRLFNKQQVNEYYLCMKHEQSGLVCYTLQTTQRAKTTFINSEMENKEKHLK